MQPSNAEARFRLADGATVNRTIKVLALDPSCDDLVARLVSLRHVGRVLSDPSLPLDHAGRVLLDPSLPLDHVGRVLLDPATDLVVMVVKAGRDAPDAARIGRICSDRRITTATFVVDAADVSDEALSRTLAQVRPWSLMVVISNEDDYVEEIVRSFR